jgi:MoaA/NifB/PqqE/SkfB family radical SAM enzyme
MSKKHLNVEIEATNQCNTRCLHCPHEQIRRPKWVMDWQSYEIISGKIMAASDDFSVEYAGMGEPLLNSQIYDFIRRVTPKGYTSLTTNASALTSQNSERQIDAGLDLLTVSFAGADADTYELMMGGLDFRRLKPAIIHCEHIHLKEKERRECEKLLRRQGYRLVVGFADTTAYAG